ncbi:MAG: flagellar assembly protein FliX [Rhodospirillales bacterium]|nr:flagellar assembly protein FliX [Rhodospirillales bacterium]
MKLTKVGSTSSVSDSKKAKKKPGSGSEFSSHLAEVTEPTDSGTVSGTSPISAVDPILSVEATPDATAHKSRTLLYQRGNDILDRLDEIRMQVLGGKLSKERLMNLAQMLRSQRAKVNDPTLISIIDEIELRAEVEIAKYTRDS